MFGRLVPLCLGLTVTFVVFKCHVVYFGCLSVLGVGLVSVVAGRRPTVGGEGGIGNLVVLECR